MCVRITQMNGVNLRKFEFDYDVTWNGFFLDEKLNVYSRYGGRDGGDPEKRLHKDALLTTMRRVLADHAEANRLRKAAEEAATSGKPPAADEAVEKAISQLLAPVEPGKSTPEDIALLKQNHQGCVHCHQVREYQLLQWAQDGVFDRRKLFGWPLPENVGLDLDLKHGTRVSKVAKDSFAAKAGLQPGDVILRAGQAPVRSEYDFRWVLHRCDDDKPLPIAVERGMAGDDANPPKQVTLDLQPTGDWRPTDLGWRKSMRSVPMDFGMRGYALTRSQRKEVGLTEEGMALRVVSIRPKGLAGNLGLQKADTIVAHGDATADRTFEQLLSDLLRQHRPGDTVELTVLRDGQRLKLSGKLPDWHTDETSVP